MNKNRLVFFFLFFVLGGSVVAHRLSEIPQFSVLLLEAGDEESMITDVPLIPSVATLTSEDFYVLTSQAMFQTNVFVFLISIGFNWGYKTEPSRGSCLGLRNGVCNWPKLV